MRSCIRSVSAKFSAAEWELRVQLAAAYRWAHKCGMSEGVCNHFTVALPDEKFLVTSYGTHWSEVTASSLLAVDSQGEVKSGGPEWGCEIDPTAFFIHEAVHRIIGDRAMCVMHTHMPYATALACMKQTGTDERSMPSRLQFIQQCHCRFFGKVAYEANFGGLALDQSEGERIANSLIQGSDKDGKPALALFLANHGVMVIGPSVAMAFDYLYYLERACMFQVMALQALGGDMSRLSRIDEETCRKTVEQKDKMVGKQAKLHMDSILRILQKDEPEFAS